jgi:hypothetical protein
MSPFLSIWFTPRKAIRQLVDSYDPKITWLLAAIGGVKEILNWASIFKLGNHYSLETIGLFVLLVGPLFGLISIFILSFMVLKTGEWFGNGKGTIQGIRAAIVWANLPVIVTMPLWIFRIMLLGNIAFGDFSSVIKANPMIALPLGLIGLIQGIGGIWCFILSLVCISEVQGFSKMNAFANMLVAALLTYLILGLPLLVFLF